MFVVYALAGSVVIVLVASARRNNRYEGFCVAAGLLLFGNVPLVPGIAVAQFRPQTIDWYLFVADRILGFDPLTFCRFVFATPWVRSFLCVIYRSLPLAIALAWVLSGRPRLMLRACILGGLLAMPFYVLFPATGPNNAFPHYPYLAPHASGLITVGRYCARNTFPSLHLGWVFLLLGNARGRWLRLALGVYAVLTGFATVGIGEHYFVDLIGSVPFCGMVQAVTERWPEWETRISALLPAHSTVLLKLKTLFSPLIIRPQTFPPHGATGHSAARRAPLSCAKPASAEPGRARSRGVESVLS